MSIIPAHISAQTCIIPMANSCVPAGFPSPALDHQNEKIDLNQHLIKHPAATFYVRVSGESMQGKGIFPNDLVIVDKSLLAKNGNIVVAILNGEFTIKEFFQDKNHKIFLKPANQNYSTIEVLAGDDFEVWGVATHVIHSLTTKPYL